MSGRILIAGGSGFIGGNIAGELWKRGSDVAVLCRHPAEARRRLHNVEVDYVKGDVREPKTLAKAVKDVQIVVACVQFPNHPVENPELGYTYEKFDGEGTSNLVAAAREAGVKRFVYLSGAGVREGRPNLENEPWMRGKLMAEHAILESGIPYTIFRPSWVYGRDDRSLNKLVKLANRLPLVPVIGDGTNRVQPLFIMDLVRAVLASLELSKSMNQTYELGGPEILTFDQIMRAIIDTLGKRRKLVHQPAWIAKLATRPLQFMKRPPLSPEAIDFLLAEELVDNSKALGDLGLQLTPLRAALPTYLSKFSKQAS